MLLRLRAVGNSVSDLTGPRFEPPTYSSRDERIATRPTGQLNYITLNLMIKSSLTNLDSDNAEAVNILVLPNKTVSVAK